MASAGEKQYCNVLTPVVCDGCGGQNDVINYCLQCPGNICSECISTHCNTRLTRDHIVLHRTHPEVVKARRSKKIYCLHHIGKEYVTYCMICEVPCCATCIIGDHKGHEFSDLESKISETEVEVDKLVHDVENELIPLSEKAISTLKDEVTSYKQSMDDVKKFTRDRIKQLIQQLARTEENLLADVDERGEKDLRIMETKQRELEENLKTVKSAIANGKTAPVDASLLLKKDELVKLKNMKPSKLACPGKFVLHTSNFQFPSALDIVGKVDNIAGRTLFDAPILIKDIQCVKILKTIENIHGYSIIQYKADQILICDTHQIEIYNHQFAKKKTIKLGFLCSDISLSSSKTVLASCLHRPNVVEVSSSGKITHLIEPVLPPYGLCVNDKEEVVIGTMSSVDIISFNDESEYDTVIEYDQGGSLFRGIVHRIRQMVSREYVVAAGMTIVFLSKEWKRRWTYEFGPKEDVRALCCDKFNNILVGDRDKNEIVMLNKDGQLMGTLLTKDDSICKPLSMEIDGKGRLWIGQEKNVLILSYEIERLVV